jgi:hypothetical protein
MKAVVYNLNNSVAHTLIPVLGSQVIRFEMKPIDYTEMQTELRRLVRLWMESGPNLARLFEKEPELRRRTMHGMSTLVPTGSGAGILMWMPTPEDEKLGSQKDGALSFFFFLITNPYWYLLAGPCKRCGKYYLKKTRRRSVYCSRKCAWTRTAFDAVRRRREKLQAAKVDRADALIGKWKKKKRRQNWKDWVVSQAGIESGITKNWLTRAVNEGRLPDPTALARVPARTQ